MRVLIIMILILNVSCITLIKRKEDKHFFCTDHFVREGISIGDAQYNCKEIFRVEQYGE